MKHRLLARVDMRTHPRLSEKWVQNQLINDPSLLGLGELAVKDVERRQPRSGRLDLLLVDPDTSTRYEVEVQLGATDESHIIRTIEYWDTERRRYPQYEHIAVIVAEQITSRFFNVISLLNGSIPIIAIQMSAYELDEDTVTIICTKVLDHVALGTDEEDEGEPTDRRYWETQSSRETMALVDAFFELVQQKDPEVELKYNKFYIGLARAGVASNYVTMRPRRRQLGLRFRISQSDEVDALVEGSGAASLPYSSRDQLYRLVVRGNELVERRDLLEAMLEHARRAKLG